MCVCSSCMCACISLVRRPSVLYIMVVVNTLLYMLYMYMHVCAVLTSLLQLRKLQAQTVALTNLSKSGKKVLIISVPVYARTYVY